MCSDSRTNSPPIEIQIRHRTVGPIIHVLREAIILKVAVAEKHVFMALAFEIVPHTFGIIDVAVCVPGPVSLDDLAGWFSSDGTDFDWRGLRRTERSLGISRDVERREDRTRADGLQYKQYE